MSKPHKVIWVDTLKALQECCHDLQAQPCFAIDTEFMRYNTYWPKLALIQIATPKKVFLIDIVALENLGPFWTLIHQYAGWVVCHAAYQDLEIFWHLAECLPQKIFDTQYAALFCGYHTPPSYGRVVQDIYNVQLDKEQQRSDWLQRPVTEEQRHYAVQDVVYLLPLLEHFQNILNHKQRLPWFLQDMAKLYAPEIFHYSPADAWVRLRHSRCNDIDLAILKQLAFWREAEAQKTNRPRQWILKDDSLYLLVKDKPCTQEEWQKTFQASKKEAKNSDKAEIVTYLIRQVLQDDIEDIIGLPKEVDKHYEARYHELRNKVQQVAQKHDLPPSLVATVDEIKAFAKDQNAKVRLRSGWRQQLLDLMN